MICQWKTAAAWGNGAKIPERTVKMESRDEISGALLCGTVDRIHADLLPYEVPVFVVSH
jgi:hypothetical protein